MPTLPQRDIYKWVAQPLLRKKLTKNYREKNKRFIEILEKDIEKKLKLHSLGVEEMSPLSNVLNRAYVDLYLIKKRGLRYIKITEKDLYSLLKKPNLKYIEKLRPEDIKMIHSLRKLLKRRSRISLNSFNSLLYSISNRLADKKNISDQRQFFQHIYQLLFGQKFGPRLGPFLFEVDGKIVNRLLDV